MSARDEDHCRVHTFGVVRRPDRELYRDRVHEWVPARARSIVWSAHDDDSDVAEPRQIENCDSVGSLSLQVILRA